MTPNLLRIQKRVHRRLEKARKRGVLHFSILGLYAFCFQIEALMEHGLLSPEDIDTIRRLHP